MPENVQGGDVKRPEAVHLGEAVRLAKDNVASGGGPFGCVIVRGDRIIARGVNRVTATNDPTAHAEIVAIREACRTLGTFQLEGCDIYSSCEPCPMCLGAIYWARPARVLFAASRAEAAAAGFDDDRIYRELPLPLSERSLTTIHLPIEERTGPFESWARQQGRTPY